MGRPLKKKFFGSGAGNQIKVRAKIGSNAEGAGFIVEQLGTTRFKVTVGGNTGICKIVDKNDGVLAANEMTISIKDSTNTVRQIVKIQAHTLVLDTGVSIPWSFDAPTISVVQMDEEGTTLLPIVSISAQPTNRSVTAPAATTFAVTAAVTKSATLSYQWQVKIGAAAYVNISNAGVYNGSTTATLSISNSTGLNGNLYRCIVSASGGATPVTSSAGTLTVA